ncbi:hypothetical protein BKE30_00380 [Alkanindiges hydrocarboniclasticus]|jgi:hypothetical protein|uniref:Uncharacterized protein n=1 Tax=Alkanindiges hydrocarboniclasticus TaxID=1907941 RepID=A0A1S8CZK0_9GAMM|nr:hypothetical protein [Alkanindiges hydrocarboniclasticus]ONG42298.1 hypothetical protein BKE30_00380 [Alkanindiges hydrocarboniclasticus]
MSHITEKELRHLEEEIPQHAREALKKAQQAALARGSRVMIARQGQLVEIDAHGHESLVKEIEQPLHFTIGQKFSRA